MNILHEVMQLLFYDICLHIKSVALLKISDTQSCNPSLTLCEKQWIFFFQRNADGSI